MLKKIRNLVQEFIFLAGGMFPSSEKKKMGSLMVRRVMLSSVRTSH